MKHLRLLTAALALSFFLLSGCEKEIDDAVSPTAEKLSKQQVPQTKEKLTKWLPSLPAGSEERLKQRATHLLETHPEYREMVLRSLGAVEATPCDANTALRHWLNQQLADWNDEVIYYALVTGMLNFPTYDALYFENSSENQYFGVKGEYTKVVTKTFKDLQRFFNIPSDDIVLAAMHGNMLLDREKVIRIDQILYGDSQEEAEFWADLILALLDAYPQYRNGGHPIFTFNAFAFSGWDYIPKKIIMGDGIMEAYTGIGFGDVAPQAILAHEFAHHVQFHLDLFEEDPENVPEATRRTELMADAYAAYYLSHARGASMQWKRVQQFLQVFFNIGDCSFSNDGHHGTPTQRMAAAEWGYTLANDAQKQGHILTVEEFAQLFDAQLAQLVVL